MKKQPVMLDLETLGNRPGAVIVAIGAVKFGGGEITDRYYRRVSARSCVAHGLRMDADTVIWWMGQSDAARMELTRPGETLPVALLDFSTWLGDAEVEMWGNGAAFDNVLLAEAYAAIGMPAPWKFWNDRCYRTMKAMHPDVPAERVGTHHNAADDAESQARHLMKLIGGVY